MTKRRFIFLLIAIMTIGVLTGCSSKPDVQSYTDFTAGIAGNNADTFGAIAEILGDTRTAAWHQEMETELATLKADAEALMEYEEVPEAYNKSHTLQVLAAEVRVEFAEDYLSAINTGDADAERAAFENLKESSVYTERALEELNKIEKE